MITTGYGGVGGVTKIGRKGNDSFHGFVSRHSDLVVSQAIVKHHRARFEKVCEDMEDKGMAGSGGEEW